MEKVTRCFMSVLLLSAVLSSGLTEEKFFGEGGTLELRPNFSGDIETVTWKLNNDMVAEWLKKFGDLTYYSTFKGRTTLDKENGTLKITNMSSADSGVYSVEINNMVRPERYNVKLIKEVPQPVVEVKPLKCAATSDSCTLHCEKKSDEAVALTEAGPVTYSWKMGEGEWIDGEKSRDITNDKETQGIKTFSCRMKNPISEKPSDPIKNIFYDENAANAEISSAGGLGTGGVIVIIIVVVLVLAIVIIVVLVKLGKLKLEDIRRRLPRLPCLPGGGVGNKDEEAERQPLDESRHTMLIFSNNKDTNDDRPCYFTVEGLYTALGDRKNITIRDYVIEVDNVDYKLTIQDIRETGRVVYVCCAWDVFRTLMVQLWKEGVELENYVFFFIDLFAEGLERHGPVRPWHRGDADDYAARQAFRSVKVLSYLEPQNAEYLQFVESLKRDAKEMFNFTIKDSLYNLIAGGFHDGVMLYSQALNETLSEQNWRGGGGGGGVQRPRGDVVTKRMWNRTFPGVMGAVEMDSNGDRQMDFAMWDMTDIESGEFQVVCVYNSGMNQMVMQKGRSFQWPGGAPPPDVPECGFKNDNPACLTRTITMHQMVAIVICFVFVIIVTITVFIYRKLKLESELAAQLWRVYWDDVQMSNLDKVLRRACSRLTMSLKGSNYGSLMTMEGNFQIYTKTGYYKGNLAAIKYINKKRIELTRKVLFELKHMRDIQNEHLTRFIGACIDPPNMCIITEYCPRGSLQDLMESDSITLDWMFRYSLITDIVTGMLFLHNSVIVSHGNLKSSNCVVDSRFVLKITDYGLESVRTASCPEDTHAYYARKLWTAPELLRMDCAPPCGTQKGDVYSFGIILQEVALLKGVFYLDTHTLTPKEIIQAVRQGAAPPLRPSLCSHSHSEELGVLVQRCWSEEPSDRPDFSTVKILLRKQHRGYGSNILDNLLSRMEQYANNLEELVEERTQAYHEEKRKAEALLYQILPQ